MKTRTCWTALAVAGMTVTGIMPLLSCANRAATRPAVGALQRTPAVSLQDRIAHGLAAASPPADSADVQARDAAADRLSRLTDLLNSAKSVILWGGFEEKKGYDPAAYRLTALSLIVWAKLYLSTFMFSDVHEVRTEGWHTVLEVAAKFRDRLDSGDYPYPFWHSPQKWQAYVDTTAVLLLFEEDRLIAAYRKARHDPTRPTAVKKWDGRWHWQDAQGRDQPRVALYSYLLSSGNPHAVSLDAAYRKLAGSFRDQSCISCHGPDNPAQADKLFLLNFPNQALAARQTLAAVLRGKMPPPDPKTGRAGGIHDATTRDDLIRLAEAFAREADAALAYETAHRAAD